MEKLTQSNTDEKDSTLWNTAKKRVRFRKSATVYIIVNAFLWVIWFFNTGSNYSFDQHFIPWPVWPMFGWGIGLAFQYAGAYGAQQGNAIEQEYQKLKRNQTNSR